MLRVPSAVLSTAVAFALVASPLSSASAHDHHHGPVFFGLAGAAVVGAAALLTAPFVIATAPFRAPVYAPPPAYYPPPAPAPAYYAPPPGYYAPPPPAYYAPPPPPAYSYPPGYAPGYYR